MRLDNRDAISKWAEEYELQVIFYDPPEVFDPAILGVARRFNSWFIVYDMEKVLENLATESGSREDAEEHFSYNVVGSWFGEETAAFLVEED